MTLSRRSPIPRGKPLARTGRLRARSAKTEQLYRTQRRPLVAALAADQPRCAVPGCNRPADDPHEPLTRARGGSITDAENVTPLCRPHHCRVDVDQPWAEALGLLRHSWDRLTACADCGGKYLPGRYGFCPGCRQREAS